MGILLTVAHCGSERSFKVVSPMDERGFLMGLHSSTPDNVAWAPVSLISQFSLFNACGGPQSEMCAIIQRVKTNSDTLISHM